jgi:hypothetical protein
LIGTSLRFYAKWRPRQVLTPANDWIGQQLLNNLEFTNQFTGCHPTASIKSETPKRGDDQ